MGSGDGGGETSSTSALFSTVAVGLCGGTGALTAAVVPFTVTCANARIRVGVTRHDGGKGRMASLVANRLRSYLTSRTPRSTAIAGTYCQSQSPRSKSFVTGSDSFVGARMSTVGDIMLTAAVDTAAVGEAMKIVEEGDVPTALLGSRANANSIGYNECDRVNDMDQLNDACVTEVAFVDVAAIVDVASRVHERVAVLLNERDDVIVGGGVADFVTVGTVPEFVGSDMVSVLTDCVAVVNETVHDVVTVNSAVGVWYGLHKEGWKYVPMLLNESPDQYGE